MNRPQQAPPGKGAVASVLIVDDNAENRLALRAILEPLGASIVEADSGLAALQAVARRTFAIILMDVRMPTMDGFETARLIRQSSHVVHTPIIFVTAFPADDMVVANAYANGAVDFMFMPVAPTVLRAKVATFVALFEKSEELHLLNTHLRDGDVLTQAVLDNVGDGILMLDDSARVRSINRSGGILFGYEAGEPVGHPFAFLIARDSRAALRDLDIARSEQAGEELAPARTVETFGCRADGSTFPMELERREISHDGQRLTLVAVRDISERRAHTETLEYLALHDGLTGLANRTLFIDLISRSIDLARRMHEPRGVLVLDLNGFKRVNDTLGHELGDELLKRVGERLRRTLRKADVVARLGGDEFGILPADATDLDAIAALAWKLQEALERGFELGGETVDVSPSIGISLFPAHGETPAELLHRADLAMYAAKRSGVGRTFFEAAHETQTADHLALMTDLRQCIARGELLLRYQPTIDLVTRAIHGVEALVRWRHPRKGLLLPASFMPEVERTYLIEPLTQWVLNEALRQQSIWLGEGFDLTMAINVSTRSLDSGGNLAEMVAGMTKKWGTASGRLTVELTEGALVEPTAPVVLGRLHEMGERVSIDDFGTGYSSLARLQRMPVDEIKIDRSFVRTFPRVGDDAVIVRSTIELARKLGLTVVAEGVEDEQTARALAEYGCNLAQGYLFGDPMPAEDLTEVLARSAAHSRRASAAPARLGAAAGAPILNGS